MAVTEISDYIVYDDTTPAKRRQHGKHVANCWQLIDELQCRLSSSSLYKGGSLCYVIEAVSILIVD